MANSGRPSNENAPRVPGEERSGLPWGRIIVALIVLALLALLIPFACQALRGGGGGAGNTQQEQNGGQEQGASGVTTNGGDEFAVEGGGGTTAAAGDENGSESAQGNEVSAEVAGGQASGDGTTVTVPRAGISGVSGWLVIRADRGGEPGDVLGYAPLREGESEEDVAVPLDEPAGSETLYAVVHAEEPADGDFTFPDGDPPVEANGSVVAEPLRYTASAGEQAGEPLPSSGGPNPLLLAGGAAALLATLAAVFLITEHLKPLPDRVQRRPGP
jgi:hypothetical protein